jgi:hypothetical protein
MAPLDGIAGALSGGSRSPGVVEGDASYDASYASRAQHHRVATTALRALRRLSTIASALGHQEERIPDDVSTRGDVDACSRASRARIYIYSILKTRSKPSIG